MLVTEVFYIYFHKQNDQYKINQYQYGVSMIHLFYKPKMCILTQGKGLLLLKRALLSHPTESCPDSFSIIVGQQTPIEMSTSIVHSAVFLHRHDSD